MIVIITQITKILMILLMGLYTIESFTVMTRKDEAVREAIFKRERRFMFMLHFLGYAIIFLNKQEPKTFIFYLVQLFTFALFLNLYDLFYQTASTQVINNMIFMMMIGFIILGRLNMDHAIRQYIFALAAMVICTLVPQIINKFKYLHKLTWLYCLIGIAGLGFVLVYASLSYGAKLSISLGPVSVQPSEFIKITYVFFIACMLYKNTSFKQVAITTIFAAIHVLILVASTDLGSALIYFITYAIMVFVATKDVRYLGVTLAGGALASVVAYFAFAHVRTRVTAWKDPFATIDGAGFQVSQSLFAIGTGGWLGFGLFQGMPDSIPVVEQDFIFSAISEEMGLIFALSLLLLCVGNYILFLNIALQIKNQFYKLIALGLGTVYGFQVFLTIGGVTKFIPSTGVTLPLISYGGSSLVSTIIIFSIIQGLYILREESHERANETEQQRG